MPNRITVGMPLYEGQELVGEALQSLQAQTFKGFEVLISVDGGDEASAEACRPFLTDERFRMVVHPQRLDWVGNFNWLLQQPMTEFFCYRQHDDTTAPDFFEKLLKLADARPDAAVIYADCHHFGDRSFVESLPSIDGERQQRLRQFIENTSPVPVRGIIRRQAIERAGLVRTDEFRSNQQVFGWLAKILQSGPALRSADTIYCRREHGDNYYKQMDGWPEASRFEGSTTLFTGLLDAIAPFCSSDRERLLFQHLILDRVCVLRPGRGYWYPPTTFEVSGALIGKCFERLGKEGNLDQWLVPDGLLAPGAELEQLRRDLAKARAETRALRASTSWRVTAPLRRLSGLLRSWSRQ